MTRRTFIREAQLLKGSSREMGRASRYVFSKGGMSDRPTQHYAKPSRAANRNRLKVNTLRGAGGVALVGSRLVPVLAYGYVLGQYLQNPFTRAKVRSPVRTEQLLQDAAYVHSITLSQVGVALSTVRTTYHAANILRKQFL
jgi:hypothetical protein